MFPNRLLFCLFPCFTNKKENEGDDASIAVWLSCEEKFVVLCVCTILLPPPSYHVVEALALFPFPFVRHRLGWAAAFGDVASSMQRTQRDTDVFSFSMWKYLRGTSTPPKLATKRNHFYSNVCGPVECECMFAPSSCRRCVFYSSKMNPTNHFSFSFLFRCWKQVHATENQSNRKIKHKLPKRNDHELHSQWINWHDWR